jgi:hypothetical protein
MSFLTNSVSNNTGITSATSSLAASLDFASLLEDLQVKANSVPADFFTAAENKYLQTVFQSYRLTSQLCLIDLLGFDLYQHLQAFLEEIKRIVPEDISNLEKAVRRLPGYFIGLYFRLLRNHATEPVADAIMDRFSASAARFVHELNQLYALSSITFKKARLEILSTASPTQIRIKKEAYETNYRSCLQQLLSLNQLCGLFSKILLSDHCNLLMIDDGVSKFKGSDALDRVKEDLSLSDTLGEIPAAADITHYLQFLTACLIAGREVGYVSVQINEFSLQHTLLRAQ